ncbi:hypothetical protein SU69_04565 [Thermosipho melanesiensis]|uniref:Uncharacterized protein n=2 Tax=Thermosipho melanesiensis TaxID=46541 RepID=A6LLF4_THEM4|nr:hypothetical protein [Thermosipho melanesiensis]ABR30755.1 hypothetical protein Tmel_0894 [Thermosipho melanesiensis BI429]APT73878.1 hypothetical protein BW47_04800 [Thermosipho melanesiensis]OOC35819.1 hypothetical protein SU68_04620 [Thermosipho melanesiensis]OOC38321.1 hypothetical protein SU69_04565 [Thermosipho melanesiensis]OOC38782.1 hypothetical protein SU70_04565 [Thermosipho melanesiensis]
MKKCILLVLIVISVFLFSESLYFEHATVYYPDGYEGLAIRIGMEFENIRDYVVKMFDNDPGRVNIFIKPKKTITNGYADPLQKNTIVIYTWHPTGYVYNYLPLDHWYRYLLIHEFTHIVTLKPREGYLKILSDFGIPYYPDLGVFSFEAPTVFSESQFSENSGRLRNPLVSQYLFATFKDDLPEDSIPNDFRVGQVYYNANGGFFEYIKEKYGMEKVNAYLKDVMSTSYSYPEIMLYYSVPYLSFLRFSMLFEDKFQKHFGSSYEEELSNWLENIKKDYYIDNYEKLVYEGKNERIYKVEKEGNSLYILKSKFGAVSGYLGYPQNKLIVVEDGKVEKEYNLSALDFRVESGKIYALLGGKVMEIWEVTENKKIAEGFISAFDVENGEVIYAIYDDKTDTSTIVGIGDRKIQVNGFVRSLVFNGVNFYYLVGNSLYRLSKNATEDLLDNYYLKGAYLKKHKGKVYLVMKYQENMELFDADTFKKLTNEKAIFDGLVDGDNVIYISYTKDGMGVYKTTILQKEEYALSRVNEKETLNASYRKTNWIEDKIYSITPSVVAPVFYFSNLYPMYNFEGWGIGSIFDFKPSVDSDLVLAPFYVNINYNDVSLEFDVDNYGVAYALSMQDERGSFISAGVVMNNKPNFYGITFLEYMPFVKKVACDKTFYLQTSVELFYTLNYNFISFTPNIGINFGDKNIGSYGSINVTKMATDTTFYPLLGSYFLNIFNQITYSYIDVNYDAKDVRYKLLLLSNIISFYKQAGVGIGVVGKNFVPSFLGYVFFGFPNSNIMYLQGGIKLTPNDGKWNLFFGVSLKPHFFNYVSDIM